MEKQYFAYINYRDFGRALEEHPDNPYKYGHVVKIVNIGKLDDQQYETLFAAFRTSKVSLISCDVLPPEQQLLAKTKVSFLNELPTNVAICDELRNIHKAACLLRERIEDEVYYLYVRVHEGYNDYNIRSCVRVVGKTQTIAALSYAKQNVKRLLEERKSGGYDDWVTYVGATDEEDDVEDKVELEGVALATEKLLCSDITIDDADFAMLFARAVVDFCQKAFPANLCFAPEINVSPPIFVAASGVCVPDAIESYQADIEDSDGTVPNVNVVNQLTKEDVTDAVRCGVREGLLDTDALSQKARDKAIRTRQEDMLLESGRTPAEISRIHNRDASVAEQRTKKKT